MVFFSPATSAAATLTISPRKVRQISDPVLKMLHIIHKIIFICQLPPTLSPNPRRRVIERFKKALFSIQSTSVNLKSELKKVSKCSCEHSTHPPINLIIHIVILPPIHKIIFICQLPPTLSPNPRRRVIERFKKALFSIQSTSVNLKSELKKVSKCSYKHTPYPQQCHATPFEKNRAPLSTYKELIEKANSVLHPCEHPPNHNTISLYQTLREREVRDSNPNKEK